MHNTPIQAVEIPVNNISIKRHYLVLSRYIYDYPVSDTVPWNIEYNTLYLDEAKADMYIIQQKKFENKPGYTKKEFKKIAVNLPV